MFSVLESDMYLPGSFSVSVSSITISSSVLTNPSSINFWLIDTSVSFINRSTSQIPSSVKAK